jgi:hypothetical protein
MIHFIAVCGRGILPILFALLLAAGCASSPIIDDSRLYISVRPDALVLVPSSELAGTESGMVFTDTAQLFDYVATLPSGTVLEHDAGCVVPAYYQLGSAKLTVDDFCSFCDTKRVKLRVYGGW